MIITFIVILYKSGRPSAIQNPLVLSAFFTFATRVMLVVLNPIQRVFSTGALSYIAYKISHVMPTLTDKNPTTAVSTIVTSIGIFTPSKHISPSTLFGRIIPLYGSIFSQASTASRVLSAQFCTQSANHRATCTFTEPLTSVVRVGACVPQNGQFSENVLSVIHKAGITWYGQDINVIFSVGHDVYSLLVNIRARLSELFQRFCEPFSLYHFLRKVNNAI